MKDKQLEEFLPSPLKIDYLCESQVEKMLLKGIGDYKKFDNDSKSFYVFNDDAGWKYTYSKCKNNYVLVLVE